MKKSIEILLEEALQSPKITIKIKNITSSFYKIWYYDMKEIDVHDYIIFQHNDYILVYNEYKYVHIKHTDYHNAKRKLKLKKLNELY